MTISHIDTEERKILDRLCDDLATKHARLYRHAHTVLKSALFVLSPPNPPRGIRPRVLCDACGKSIPVTTRNVLRAHRKANSGQYCDGSGAAIPQEAA